MPAWSQLRVGNVVEADNTCILVILLFLYRTLERNWGRGRDGRQGFLLGSDAYLLVPLPVRFLVLRGAVLGFEATGACLVGGLLIAGESTAHCWIHRGYRRQGKVS